MTLYHGTRAGFRGAGGLLLPRATHGGPGTTAPATRTVKGADEWVYVTGSLVLAWVYAWHAPGRGRPRVLVVTPCGELRRDPEHSVAMDAWRCEAARVERVLLEPAVSEEDARNGWV